MIIVLIFRVTNAIMFTDNAAAGLGMGFGVMAAVGVGVCILWFVCCRMCKDPEKLKMIPLHLRGGETIEGNDNEAARTSNM